MKGIVNGRILMPDGEISGKTLLFGETIIGITKPDEAEARAEEIIDAEGAYVTPGLIDTHIHGYMGDDASDGDAMVFPEDGEFAPEEYTEGVEPEVEP